MRRLRLVLPALLAALLLPAAASAQTAKPPQDGPGIVVNGRLVTKKGNKPIPMSDWRVAETEHVLVYSRGDEAMLTRIAHNLEKLHFLLSMLFDRVDAPDDTLKLRVTLIGDTADFNHLDLHNVRWQQGPYPAAFPTELYYDPREDGAVLATTHTDQQIMLQRGRDLLDLDELKPNDVGTGIANTLAGLGIEPGSQKVDEIAFPLSADGRLYAGFAQHYLMTYFPAAYPRWYLEGFGEIFATLNADRDGMIEYGRAPEGFRDVVEWFGRYPLAKLMDGSYLDEHPRRRPRWTPLHAWALVHLLFFSDEWRQPLHDYLSAVAHGESAEAAAATLDLGKLQGELAGYRGAKVPYEQLVYPADRAPPPLVRQLTRSEAAYLKGKLELGARLELPPAPPPGADPETAARMDKARRDAIVERDAWIAGQRETAARYPDDLDVQLLLAEAECRSDHVAECIAAADRVLAVSPKRPAALGWKGLALARQAMAGPAERREAGLKAARKLIVQANRSDPDAIQPLLAYYRSFADAGEPVPEVAVRALMKANDGVPSAPATRLMLGEALARRGDTAGARRILLPIAFGAYETPERPKAQALLAEVGANGRGGGRSDRP